MAKIKDGEQAFPHDGQIDYTKSMTLRDYFAAKAMQGLLSADNELKFEDYEIADYAYQQADAMLAERERGE